MGDVSKGVANTLKPAPPKKIIIKLSLYCRTLLIVHCVTSYNISDIDKLYNYKIVHVLYRTVVHMKW